LNRNLDLIGNIFVGIFLIESILKIMALGLVCGRKAYLKSGWNILDFLVVVTGVVEIILESLAIQ